MAKAVQAAMAPGSARPVALHVARLVGLAQRAPAANSPSPAFAAGPLQASAGILRAFGWQREPSLVGEAALRAGWPALGARRPSVVQRMETPPMEVEESGVQVVGALSSEQLDDVIDGGQTKGKNDAIDVLADQIFATGLGQSLTSQVTGAIGITEITTGESPPLVAIFLAQQSGKTKRNRDAINELLAPMGYKAFDMDDLVSGSPLHGEMTIVANMLLKSIPLESLQRVGVAGKKGCCRLCSGMLSHLGVKYSHTHQSAWEEQTWADPYAKAGKKNPFIKHEKKF